jgi:phage protein D
MDEPFASVKIEGEEVGDLLEHLVVEESDCQADLATLTFGDSHRVLSDIFHEGLVVEIDLGRPDSHAVIFKGAIAGIRALFPAQGQATVEVQALDSLIQLNYQAKTRRWWNTTVSQIVRDIAIANQLLPGTVAPSQDELFAPGQPRQQVNETDLAFLHHLAQDYDCKLSVDHGSGPDTLNFVATQTLLDAEPIEYTLEAQTTLLDFTAYYDTFATAAEGYLVTTDPETGDRITLSSDWVALTTGQWVPDAQRLAQMGAGAARLTRLLALSASKRSRLRDFWRVPPRQAGAPARSQQSVAGTLGDSARRLGQRGQGRARGNVGLRPRRRVVIAGLGGRWSGDWYLAQVHHEMDFSHRRYVSSFVCTR